MRSLGPRQRASLVHHYAVLGKVNSLTALAETYGVDVTASCPDTRQNILHTALVENWPEVVKLAIRYQQLFLEHDIFGRTPQNLLDTLTSEDPRKMIVALSILWGLRFSHSAPPQTQPVSGPVGFDTSELDFAVRPPPPFLLTVLILKFSLSGSFYPIGETKDPQSPQETFD